VQAGQRCAAEQQGRPCTKTRQKTQRLTEQSLARLMQGRELPCKVKAARGQDTVELAILMTVATTSTPPAFAYCAAFLVALGCQRDQSSFHACNCRYVSPLLGTMRGARSLLSGTLCAVQGKQAVAVSRAALTSAAALDLPFAFVPHNERPQKPRTTGLTEIRCSATGLGGSGRWEGPGCGLALICPFMARPKA
jgi:hypothetical protein